MSDSSDGEAPQDNKDENRDIDPDVGSQLSSMSIVAHGSHQEDTLPGVPLYRTAGFDAASMREMQLGVSALTGAELLALPISPDRRTMRQQTAAAALQRLPLLIG